MAEYWICGACEAINDGANRVCDECDKPRHSQDVVIDAPPEFAYVGVAMGSHGGHAHVAPDIDPATLAALGTLMDAAYDQAVAEGEADHA